MEIRSLYLRNFRRYREAFFEFKPGINLIHGNNAQGKTTLLEALYCFSVGKSFRTPAYKDLISHEAPSFFIEVEFVHHHIQQKIRFFADPHQKRIFLNETLLSTVSALIGIIQGVVITPDDMSLIKGTPLTRRHYLDLQLSQGDRTYLYHLSRYNRAMRQRNQLLKEQNLQTIEIWEQEMAVSAAYITKQRLIAIQEIQRFAQGFYLALSKESALLKLAYSIDFSPNSSLDDLNGYYQEKFQKNREREVLLGYTQSGPHRHDLHIFLDDKEVKHFASEGQQRSCIHALRFGEWTRLKKLGTQIPIFMIDDLGMSLDEHRKSNLFEQLTQLGQVFLTATDPSLVYPELMTRHLISLQEKHLLV